MLSIYTYNQRGPAWSAEWRRKRINAEIRILRRKMEEDAIREYEMAWQPPMTNIEKGGPDESRPT